MFTLYLLRSIDVPSLQLLLSRLLRVHSSIDDSEAFKLDRKRCRSVMRVLLSTRTPSLTDKALAGQLTALLGEVKPEKRSQPANGSDPGKSSSKAGKAAAAGTGDPGKAPVSHMHLYCACLFFPMYRA